MSKSTLVFLFFCVALLFSGCSIIEPSSSVKHDLDLICSAYTDLQNPDIKEEDIAYEAMKIHQTTLSNFKLKPSSQIFEAIQNADPKDRYKFLTKYANEQKVENWECESLRKIAR